MIEKIRANLFPKSWPAVEPWRKFKWDRGQYGIRTWQVNSSQALAIDVFGTIKSSPERDFILNAVADRLGIKSEGEWTLDFEWIDPHNRTNLNEKRRTQVDVVARNAKSLIFFECKFSEQDGGACSRPIPKLEFGGLAECNSNYELQCDPIRYALFDYYHIPVLDAKCALTRVGIRYWRYIPEVLRLDPQLIYKPCPFSGSLYQWMRNMVLCWRIASVAGIQPVFVIAFAHGEGLPMSDRIRSKAWDLLFAPVRREAIVFQTMSYQEIIRTAMVAIGSAGKDIDVWVKLERWAERKIATVQKFFQS